MMQLAHNLEVVRGCALVCARLQPLGVSAHLGEGADDGGDVAVEADGAGGGGRGRGGGGVDGI